MSYAETARTGWMSRPSALPCPGPREVHVWRARISAPEAHDWVETLAPDERERADRFRVADDRRRFTATRAVLRMLLGQYLALAPRSLRFTYDRYGKPALDRSRNSRGITFNVAHSGDCALLAFGLNTDVGIDVEHLRIERNVVELAKTLLTPSQFGRLLMQPEAARKREFLQAWTRSEAVGKALGAGISVAPGVIERALVDASQWSICDIDVRADYVAALAAQVPGVRLRFWDCQS